MRCPAGTSSSSALADDRDRAAVARDSSTARRTRVPQPFVVPLLDLGIDRVSWPVRPGIGSAGVTRSGVPLESWPRRILLAWALQAPELLGPLASDAQGGLGVDAARRLARLAPFAEWGDPVARVSTASCCGSWMAMCRREAFPLATRIEWKGEASAGMRAAMLATVSAQTGATRIYLRPGSDALASSWAAVAGGVVEPSTSMPDAVWRAAPYPVDLFRVQARRIEQSVRTIGSAGGRAGHRPGRAAASGYGVGATIPAARC